MSKVTEHDVQGKTFTVDYLNADQTFDDLIAHLKDTVQKWGGIGPVLYVYTLDKFGLPGETRSYLTKDISCLRDFLKKHPQRQVTLLAMHPSKEISRGSGASRYDRPELV